MNQRRLSNSLICLASIVGMQSVSAAALAIDNAAIASNSPPISVITPTAQPDVLLPDQIHILSLYNQTSKIYPMHIGRLECAPDSAVYVINTLRSTAIFVLDQKNKGDVRVIVNDKTFRALPGEEILLSKVPDKTFVQLNPNLGIPYRGARLVGAVGDVRVFKNEYLMGTAFLHIPHIAKLIDSTDGADQKTVRRLLKSAALAQPLAMGDFESEKHISSIHKDCQTTAAAANSKMLQGAVEEFDIESSHGKVIDLTIDSAYEKKDPDVCLLRESLLDWASARPADVKDLMEHRAASAVVMCTDDCFIKTELSTIKCKCGTKLFIDNHGEVMTICILDGKGAHDVIVKAGSLPAFPLMPGKVAALRRHGPACKQGPAHLITYRNWSEKVTAGDTDLYGGEFSIMSALFAIEPLRVMIDSKDPKQRAQAQSIIKAATVLADMNPRAQFQPHY